MTFGKSEKSDQVLDTNKNEIEIKILSNQDEKVPTELLDTKFISISSNIVCDKSVVRSQSSKQLINSAIKNTATSKSQLEALLAESKRPVLVRGNSSRLSNVRLNIKEDPKKLSVDCEKNQSKVDKQSITRGVLKKRQNEGENKREDKKKIKIGDNFTSSVLITNHNSQTTQLNKKISDKQELRKHYLEVLRNITKKEKNNLTISETDINIKLKMSDEFVMTEASFLSPTKSIKEEKSEIFDTPVEMQGQTQFRIEYDSPE
jgi:hypothetical protein